MGISLRVAAASAAATTVVAGLGVSAASAATATTALSGNVPSFATAAHRNGSVSTSAKVTISVYLNPRNAAGLEQFVRDVSTPGTSSYRHYLTAAQYHAAYSPSPADVDAVKSFLSDAGLKVDAVASNRAYVDATGTVAQVEKALHVTQATYAVQGQSVRSNAEAPRVPSSLASKIQFIGGLDSTWQLAKPAAPPPVAVAPVRPCSNTFGGQIATVTPAMPQPYGGTLPFPVCGYTPTEIRAAYGLPAYAPGQTMTGKGVRVGIVDAFASPTEPADLNRFSQEHGLPYGQDLDFTAIVPPGVYNEPNNPRWNPTSWYGEETLDLIAVHSIAPEASIVYAAGQNAGVPLDHALEQLIDRQLVDVVSNSWGFTGEPLPLNQLKAERVAFLQAAAEGISVLFSSGDDGDVGELTGLAQASWPASSDFVTAVGGTSLLTNADGSKSEYGWGTYFSNLKKASLTGNTVTHDGTEAWPPAFLFGAGGGASPHILQPGYQTGVVGDLGDSAVTYDADGPSGSITYSQPRRVVPDVAMDADPYTGLLYGETFTVSSFDPNNVNQDGTPCDRTGGNTEYCESSIGGTSLASPLFAGVLALVDQPLVAAHEPTVGFINPAIYGSARSAFTDVLPPSDPLAFVRTRQTPTGLSARFVTINNTVDGSGTWIPGADTSLRTTAGYDNVTGVGTPVIPDLVAALG